MRIANFMAAVSMGVSLYEAKAHYEKYIPRERLHRIQLRLRDDTESYVSEHVVLHASLHGRWLPIFIFDAGFSSLTVVPGQLCHHFRVELSLRFLFRLYLFCRLGIGLLSTVLDRILGLGLCPRVVSGVDNWWHSLPTGCF